jgi:hypothetical protein
MEELIQLDDFSDIVIPKTVFVALYEEDTGKVISVGPDLSFKDKKNKILVDEETALSIIKGDVSIGNCFVDPDTNKLEIVENKTFLKIDDILHRVPDSRFTELERIDVLIKHNLNSLEFNLVCKPEKISSSELSFLLTDYNDPNVLYQRINISKQSLINGPVLVNIEDDVTDFSIFTKRIIGTYLNYLIEVV